MKAKSLFRLEWISLVYLALFVLAVLSPSIVKQDFLWIQERHVEEIMIFIFGIVGLAIFSIYQRMMERHEREHENARNEYERVKRELVESYKYIGAVNRKIEVLKRLSNQTSLSVMESDHLAKDLLTSLLLNAAVSTGSETAVIRYVELEKSRTEYEIYHHTEEKVHFKISNKELIKLHNSGISHAIIRAEDGKEILAVPSDKQGKPVKAYLLLAVEASNRANLDTTLLKVFANQAELLRYSLLRSDKSLAAPAIDFQDDEIEEVATV